MKKILTLLFSIATTALVAQQLPNNGFENWTSKSAFGGGTYMDLNNWTTISNATSGLALTVTQTADAYAGSFAADLTSGIVQGSPAPGMICQCEINVLSQKIIGGVPYTGKPTSVQGYIKYAPVGHDSMYIGIFLTHWDATNHKRDTLAEGGFLDSATIKSYTKIVSGSFYYNPTYSSLTPDTLIFSIGSSKTPSNAHSGSDLKLDNFQLNGVTATDNIFSKSYISVYPNPAQTVLNISTSNTDAQYANVYDITGKLIIRQRITSNLTTIQLNNMTNGLYIYSITNASGQSIKTGKVTVAK